MRLPFLRTGGLVAAALLLLGLAPLVHAQSEPDVLVGKAESTLQNFLKDPEMTWLQKNIGRAKAVLITPEIVKAGFIVGGSGGRALLLAHDAGSAQWRGPAFYTLATASIGFQAGVQASENVTLVMTDKGLNSLLAPSVKLGGDASVAAGPVGAGAASDVTTDFVSFARSKGVYGGLNLDGTVISVNNDWNDKYYGKKVLPPDIIVRGNVSNPNAKPLVTILSSATGK
jgi:lipid-binding SYLF domain-containing protein